MKGETKEGRPSEDDCLVPEDLKLDSNWCKPKENFLGHIYRKVQAVSFSFRALLNIWVKNLYFISLTCLNSRYVYSSDPHAQKNTLYILNTPWLLMNEWMFLAIPGSESSFSLHWHLFYPLLECFSNYTTFLYLYCRYDFFSPLLLFNGLLWSSCAFFFSTAVFPSWNYSDLGPVSFSFSVPFLWIEGIYFFFLNVRSKMW